MNERLALYREQIKNRWDSLTNKQKMLIGSTALFVVIFLGIYIYVASQPVYKQLFDQRLSLQEIGTIKEELDKMNVPYHVTGGGTGIEVPEVNAQDALVELAAQGIPKEAGFSSDLFSNNWGATDRQLDIIEREALQREIKNMLKKVEGVGDAQVILTLPEEKTFIGEAADKATASVIVNVKPGARLSEQQVKALYFIVSRSVPKLPVENITITDQYSDLLEMTNESGNATAATAFETQEKIKADIERKIQQNIYNLLGTIMGKDKVIVQAYVQMNFAQENREEKLVVPVDKETNEGIIISAEKLSKTFSGQGPLPSGLAGTGDNAVPNYPSGQQQGANSQYEELHDVVNREVNRITKNVTESPYKIEDITINVGVEPPEGGLDEQTTAQIRQILRNVVRVTISEEGVELTQQQLDDHVSVFARSFSGKVVADQQGLSPTIIYGAGALALLALAAVAFLVYRRRRQVAKEGELITDLPTPKPFEVPELQFNEDTDEVVVRKQLEKLARSNPDEFIVLLRTWLAEE